MTEDDLQEQLDAAYALHTLYSDRLRNHFGDSTTAAVLHAQVRVSCEECSLIRTALEKVQAEKATAYGRLRDAAPDLLTACKMALAAQTLREKYASLDMMRVAITKAEGGMI